MKTAGDYSMVAMKGGILCWTREYDFLIYYYIACNAASDVVGFLF
jgi:hypothetical protein